MDVELHYREQGSGETLILLHGNGEDGSYFEHQMSASFFGRRSGRARRNAEMLGLMVNDPNIAPEELAALSMPTLVVAGTRDMIKEEHTRFIASSIPDARLAFVEGDHFVARKNRAEFNEAAEGFLLGR